MVHKNVELSVNPKDLWLHRRFFSLTEDFFGSTNSENFQLLSVSDLRVQVRSDWRFFGSISISSDLSSQLKLSSVGPTESILQRNPCRTIWRRVSQAQKWGKHMLNILGLQLQAQTIILISNLHELNLKKVLFYQNPKFWVNFLQLSQINEVSIHIIVNIKDLHDITLIDWNAWDWVRFLTKSHEF